MFRLIGTLDRQAFDIAGAAPSVLETVKSRNAVEFELLKQGQLSQAIRLCSGMAADSKGWLQASAMLAISVVSDPDRSAKEKQAAWYFMKAVVPRGARAMHDAEIEPRKKKGALERAVDVADAAVKIDKGVDAVQEVVGEGTGWATEVFTQVASGNWFGLGG